MTLIKQFPVYYPKSEVQDTIVSGLRALDDKADTQERIRAALTSLFRTLLHRLMTAQIRVGNLDLSGLAETAPMASMV
jgi:type I restriction enzyme S subunit